MKKVDIILAHMKEDCAEIIEFTQGLDEEQFINNALVRKAVCMSLINGENGHWQKNKA